MGPAHRCPEHGGRDPDALHALLRRDRERKYNAGTCSTGFCAMGLNPATGMAHGWELPASPRTDGHVVFFVELIANGFIQYTEHAIPLLPEGVRERRGIDRERLYPVDVHRLCDF